MKLKDWRKKKKMSQVALASELELYARKNFPIEAKKLGQTTLCSWERGTLPRKMWLTVLRDFTKGQVGPADFVPTEKSPRGA